VGISFILPSPSLWTSKNEKFRGSFSPFPSHLKNPPFTHPSLRRKKMRKIANPSFTLPSEGKKYKK